MKRISGRGFVLAGIIVLMLSSFVFAAGKTQMTRRFVGYRSLGKLHLPSGAGVVDKFEKVARDAAKHGYNGMILQYVDFLNVEKYANDPEFNQNWGRIKAIAKSLNLSLVPWTLGQWDEAREDTTLSEAFPVKGTKFRVANGTAKAYTETPIVFKNGDFETAKTNGQPEGWACVASPNVAKIVNTGARFGNGCLMATNPHRDVYFDQCVTLKPFRAYEIELWVKTEGFTRSRYISLHVFSEQNAPLLYRRDVCFRTPDNWYGVGQTQAWRPFKADFNTLRNSWVKVRLNLTPVAASEGKVWVDGLKIREVGLYETVRNAHTPITVKSATGITYKEGSDFTVDYRRRRSVDHDYEGSLRVPAGSRIRNGDVLTVDWYQLADVETMVPPTNYCLDKSWEIKADNIRQIDGLLRTGDDNSTAPRAWYAYYDEWRVANWDERPGFKTSGEYMAWAMEKTDRSLKTANPNREVWVPNDMFDPHHNAHESDRMGMANGGAAGSWEGMHDSTVVINWLSPSYGGQARSPRFFAGVDPKYPDVNFRQMISTNSAGMCKMWADTMDKIESEGGTGFVGFLYVDWTENFSRLGECAQVFKQAGRWGSGPVQWTAIKRGVAPISSKALSASYSLEQNQIHVTCNLASASKIRISFVDLLGRTIHRVGFAGHRAGQHKISIAADKLPAGVHFMKLSVNTNGGETQSVIHKILTY